MFSHGEICINSTLKTIFAPLSISLLTLMHEGRNISNRACVEKLASAEKLLGCRLMAGQRFLVPYVRVRLLPPQPFFLDIAKVSGILATHYVAPSSSGLGRRPLKAEVAGSNPVGATKKFKAAGLCPAAFFISSELSVALG